MLTIRHFPPDGGGAEMVALQVSKKMRQWAVPIHVLTGRYGKRPPADTVDCVAVRTHFVGPYVKGMHELCYLISFAWQVVVRRNAYDIIHSFQVNLSTLIAVVLAKWLGKAVVATAHGAGATGDVALWRKIPFGNMLLRYMACRVDGCTGVSREVMRELSEVGFRPERTWYIPNGVSVPDFQDDRIALRQRFGLPQEAVIGIFVGRLSPEKAPEVLIRAWPYALREHGGLHLLFVGDGNLRSRLEKQAKGVGDGCHVSFTGWVQNVSDYLMSADFFLLPSQQEGMPLAMLEAMAVGLPVVATRIKGIADIVEVGKTGLLFEPGDIHALAKHIVSLAASRKRREKMGEEAKKSVEANYRLDVVCRRYLDVYRAIAPKRL
jgi:glycosyltransferase involved in cell wall biosynthesis